MDYAFHNMENPVLPFFYHEDSLHAGSKCWRNWHENIELLYFCDGAADMICDGISCRMETGSLCVVNANCFHETHPAPAACTACLSVGREFFVQNGLDVSKLAFEPFLTPEAVGARFGPVRTAFAAKGPWAAAGIRQAVLELLLWLVQTHAAPRAAAPAPWRGNLLQATRYIRGRARFPITVDDVAHACGISASHLMHEFKKTFGCTVVTYIQRVRCEHAKTLLSADNLSVQECAHHSGFADASYFSRVFTRHTGLSPQAYRRARWEKMSALCQNSGQASDRMQ